MRVDVRKIKDLLKERNMSRIDLAEATGIDYYSLASVFTRGACSPERLSVISEALGVDEARIIKPNVLLQDAVAMFLIGLERYERNGNIKIDDDHWKALFDVAETIRKAPIGLDEFKRIYAWRVE